MHEQPCKEVGGPWISPHPSCSASRWSPIQSQRGKAALLFPSFPWCGTLPGESHPHGPGHSAVSLYQGWAAPNSLLRSFPQKQPPFRAERCPSSREQQVPPGTRHLRPALLFGVATCSMLTCFMVRPKSCALDQAQGVKVNCASTSSRAGLDISQHIALRAAG